MRQLEELELEDVREGQPLQDVDAEKQGRQESGACVRRKSEDATTILVKGMLAIVGIPFLIPLITVVAAGLLITLLVAAATVITAIVP